MATSSECWASGIWTVRAGSEDEFVTRWRAWLEWTSQNAAGFRSATLIRSEADGRRFESFSDWDSAGYDPRTHLGRTMSSTWANTACTGSPISTECGSTLLSGASADSTRLPTMRINGSSSSSTTMTL